MRIPYQQLGFTIIAALALMPAIAQGTATQNPGIDLALLAKANGGDAAAQVLMGDNSCAAGNAVSRTPRESAEYYKVAAAWYRKAAEQNSLAGELRLAELYRDGKGLPRDMVQAAAWYRKAAEQGDTGAQGTLGLLYSLGQGVPKSYVEAYYWLDLAAAVKGPKQQQYAANRQMIGTRITADELADLQDRAASWLAVHPRPNQAQ